MAKKSISYDRASTAGQAMAMRPEGKVFIDYLFQELGYGESIGSNDPRKQDKGVALHDFAVTLKALLNKE